MTKTGSVKLKENSLEIVRGLKKKFAQWGITTVCWDFDDTLIDTANLFNQAMIDAGKILLFSNSAKGVNIKPRRVKNLKEEVMEDILWQLRSDFGVKPSIMEMTILLTAKQLGLKSGSPQVDQAVERVKQIYKRDVPTIFAEAVESLDLLNRTGIRSILITHAEEEWTLIKRLKTGLIGKFERIICFSIDYPKSIQWEKHIKNLKLEPQRLLIIGDNFAADIQPTVKLGARAIWVINKRPRVCDSVSHQAVMSKEPVLGERILKAKRIENLVGVILKA